MQSASPLSLVWSRTRDLSRGRAATTAALRDRVDLLHADAATVDLPAAGFDVVLFSWSI